MKMRRTTTVINLRSLLAPAVVIAFLVGCGKPKPPAIDSWAAASTGNIKALQQHLAAGTDLDANSPSRGGTPLHLAAVFGQTEVARLLLKNQAQLESTDRNGSTPVMLAAFFAHPEIVKVLLENGAEVNAKNKDGYTPLDAVAGQWTPQLENLYQSIKKTSKIPLDLEKIKAVITVVKSGDKFKIACQADLKAPVAATPAVDQNNLYVRTDEAVMDFR